MKCSIRQVDARDPEIKETLLRMQRECLPGDVPMPPQSGFWWICYTEHGIPAAFCSLHASIRWALTGYLSRSGVLPKYQGQGLQKRMIRVREAKARRMGWKWLISDTSQNPASANSLIACGFKMYEPSRPYGLSTAVYWRKALK